MGGWVGRGNGRALTCKKDEGQLEAWLMCVDVDAGMEMPCVGEDRVAGGERVDGKVGGWLRAGICRCAWLDGWMGECEGAALALAMPVTEGRLKPWPVAATGQHFTQFPLCLHASHLRAAWYWLHMGCIPYGVCVLTLAIAYVCAVQGDSWTVAFHDAEDAVAFSLQVYMRMCTCMKDSKKSSHNCICG